MKFHFTVLASCMLCVACGGGGGGDVLPELIAGGGVKSSPVNGMINVYAIDKVTGLPISGASVRVGAAADAQALTGLTDSTGLVTFKDGKLAGAQTITVTGPAPTPPSTDPTYTAVTWFGVNGANATIPLSPFSSPAPTIATVEGTIQGWESLPTPVTGHYWLGAVGFSQSKALDDNKIAQDQAGGKYTNLCIKADRTGNSCNWKLKTRIGTQALFAVILDIDTHGTAIDFSDDTAQLKGYAVKTGVSLDAGQSVTGQSLEMIADADLADINVSFQGPPAGLEKMTALPLLELGLDGVLYFPSPAITPEKTSNKIPTLAGALASGKHQLVATAKSPSGDAAIYSIQIQREFDIAQPVSLGEWLATPTDISAQGGAYSFSKASGANIYSGDFLLSNTRVYWSVLLLDGASSFILPTLSPEVLPPGTLELRIQAYDIPGLNPLSFSTNDSVDAVLRISQNKTTFSH